MEQTQLKELIIEKAINNINNDVDLDSFNADESKTLLTKLFSIPGVTILENASDDKRKLTSLYIRLIATFTCNDGGSKSDYYACALAEAFEDYGLKLPTHATGEYGKFVEYIVESIKANAIRTSEELSQHQKLATALGSPD
ncbi:hypothetical protein FC36_GL000223 [Ligilactobacillus equi DSM 15833 = JCM 10991]|uniref:Uncharacterized protein n=2 Tax=Ligilactobacillus equi TaxID=137357 RepID=A0A0R1TSF5_9LACO|nr:hypothetical protein [Ligilactobacillus equi]KRL84300.1 hypothetical protein FC36_GL000223 [Ligilactobacillus equi DSM 15833 = JCM 10991]